MVDCSNHNIPPTTNDGLFEPYVRIHSVAVQCGIIFISDTQSSTAMLSVFSLNTTQSIVQAIIAFSHAQITPRVQPSETVSDTGARLVHTKLKRRLININHNWQDYRFTRWRDCARAYVDGDSTCASDWICHIVSCRMISHKTISCILFTDLPYVYVAWVDSWCKQHGISYWQAEE